MKSVMETIKLDDKNLINLKKSYCDSLNNKNFRIIVDELKIPMEFGVKYTSSIEDAALERSNCCNCKGLFNCKNKIQGFKYCASNKKNHLDFSYVSCKYMNESINNNKYQENVKLFDIPREIKDASLKEVYTDDKNRIQIIKYIKSFISMYDGHNFVKGIYLNGSFGSGKTYLIAALFNELAKKGYRSSIIYFPEFLRKLKSSFSDGLYEEKFSYIKNIPLLLIDDIGAENLTSWGRDEVLGPILQYRMDEKLPTFFTSNLSVSDLEKHLSVTSNNIDKIKGRRIVERIKFLTEDLELVSKNRRN